MGKEPQRGEDFMSSPLEPAADAHQAGLVLVPERFAVRIGEQEVVLTPTQFRLLSVLSSEPSRTFSCSELVEQGIGDLVSERTVDVHVKELRRKLGSHAARIETVRRRGYRYQEQPLAS
jgi:DNA-binding response OmpR family regulator